MKRKAEYPIEPLLLDRWSPRAMSGQDLNNQELMSLFEAARWAPSSYNNQPWRFIYATKKSAYWQQFFDLLVPANQEWAQNASVLVVIVSYTLFSFNKKPSRTHSFDTGSAWQNLALQGHAMGLVVHAMEGFDYKRTQELLKIPADYSVEAMIAIGKPAPKETLPQKLQEKEEPSNRKPIKEFVFEGYFKKL